MMGSPYMPPGELAAATAREAAAEDRPRIAQEAALAQCQLYRETYRIPAEVVPDTAGVPWVEMPVSASTSAVCMPTGIAREVFAELCVPTIEYARQPHTHILVFPDAVTADQRGALKRLGITIAVYGSRVRLPVGACDLPFWWARPLLVPAYLPRLSEIATVAAAFERRPR
ncbi:hypothetical protein NDR87_26290 [Nocardia sp. CDC159]|uniref:Uncharacterized protein n=1 Tax=Nocardia pulmonis TaxID=2951408 RepID=A0A9X2E618_9NOCA|nr:MULTISPECIES: hypothetical protein [Nocardia]MCM6774957.1 hypothetical protein [Nocardia pulmonis]MCM6789888.1 hypothetical protein [Nocardia sp. CDC159]